MRTSPQRRSPFQVTRHNVPIQEYPVVGGKNLGIAWGRLFDEAQAVVAVGLDFDKWVNNKYGRKTVAYAIAYKRIVDTIENHRNHEQNKEMKRASKKKR